MVSKYTKDSDDGVPMGTIIAAVFKDPPKGYIKCDGSTIDQNLYPKLAGLLQSESAPDLTHKFLRGIDNEQVLSSKEQSTAVNGLKIEPADHTHDYKSYKDGGSGQPGSGDFVASQAGGYSAERGINYVYANDGSTTSPVQVQSLAINSSDDETAPEHVFVYFFIKAE